MILSEGSVFYIFYKGVNGAAKRVFPSILSPLIGTARYGGWSRGCVERGELRWHPWLDVGADPPLGRAILGGDHARLWSSMGGDMRGHGGQRHGWVASYLWSRACYS